MAKQKPVEYNKSLTLRCQLLFSYYYNDSKDVHSKNRFCRRILLRFENI